MAEKINKPAEQNVPEAPKGAEKLPSGVKKVDGRLVRETVLNGHLVTEYLSK